MKDSNKLEKNKLSFILLSDFIAKKDFLHQCSFQTNVSLNKDLKIIWWDIIVYEVLQKNEIFAIWPYYQPVPYRKYWAGYESIMRFYDGQPHWAKTHTMFRSELEKAYPLDQQT
ncbi:L-gulonolactone/D-arabinono-1,4-lactone oxidase [Gigaspora margarita]|uniref:L-gulonolactone/D-arabinono-1,4-lactone oxidase n=1 Tax=Gigaspora margarita TaxID=4874 RepID=A0A8H3X2V4_GIGMA|nr:L-gulonolactone/D-arabinono-1,4-lactone oxidase [Gigaspora margarita]